MFTNRDKVHYTVHQGLANVHILVVGDVILDRYLWGEVNRISPEAPVPVVRVKRESENGGGAANVALNLTGLSARASLVGYVGKDGEAKRLNTLLINGKVDFPALVARQGWPTITKTRVLGGHQQMLRLDWEESQPATPKEQNVLLDQIQQALGRNPQAVILSDYAKGVLSPQVCQQVIQACRQDNRLVLVDPKGKDYSKYQRATAISPNRQELAAATGQPLEDLTALLRAGVELRQALEVDFLAVTLSDLGIALIDEQGVRRLPSLAREVFDVSGAGDTVISTLTAALAAGCNRLDALQLANLAAGVVVGKVGTTPISRVELQSALASEQALEQSSKMATLAIATEWVHQWHQNGEKVV
ncbi:MAG: D-glycero-beta-D-manno-heptose-7-phosphate kinase, partial [Magnetococcales bacterium]|nr:D-glycero-beta-D-manno-heptose-7-phosphate kinase [Magnetococcales bacterium]